MLSALRTSALRTSALRTSALAALLAAAALGCDEPPGDGECAPGTAGCACLEGELCTGSLACDTGVCRDVDRREVEVTDPSARSCELVLVEDGTEVLGVTFGAGVEGTSIHEAPRTAIAFLREGDAPFASGAVTVTSTEATGRLTLDRARCFDRDGAEIAGESLRVGG